MLFTDESLSQSLAIAFQRNAPKPIILRFSKAWKISIKLDPSQKVKSETLIVEIIGQWSLLISLESGKMELWEVYVFVK